MERGREQPPILRHVLSRGRPGGLLTPRCPRPKCSRVLACDLRAECMRVVTCEVIPQSSTHVSRQADIEMLGLSEALQNVDKALGCWHRRSWSKRIASAFRAECAGFKKREAVVVVLATSDVGAVCKSCRLVRPVGCRDLLASLKDAGWSPPSRLRRSGAASFAC